MRETGRVDNFVRAAEALRGEPLDNTKPPGYPFDDTDLYKVIEGASYALSVHPDPKLEAYVDGLIAKIAAAQEPDGYLYTTRTIDPQNPHRWAGRERWVLEKVDSHELYNLGHLYEAAVAHYQATGKRTLLDVAIKTADLLDAHVRSRQACDLARAPDHRDGPGQALSRHRRAEVSRPREVHARRARSGRATRAPAASTTSRTARSSSRPRPSAMRCARPTCTPGWPTWRRSPATSATRRRATRSGTTSSARSCTSPAASARQAAARRSARHYELPNMTAYNETCAAIGNDYWNHRLFLLHGDAKYIDVMERTLYNGLISGVSLDGKSFFYPNPLESTGSTSAARGSASPAVPGNITRFLASVPGYVYATQGDAIYVNLFAAGRADDRARRRATVELVQETRYPWDGAMQHHGHARCGAGVRRSSARCRAGRGTSRCRAISIASRTPSPIPSRLTVNGVAGSARRSRRATPSIERDVEGGRRRRADRCRCRCGAWWRNEQVAADRGRVALQRGPIVYAAEWPDNPGGRVRNLVLPDDAGLTTEFRPELLNGVQVVRAGPSRWPRRAGRGHAQASRTFTAIPYCAWANRGRGEMVVWIPNGDDVARPTPLPTVAIDEHGDDLGQEAPAGDQRRRGAGVVRGSDLRISTGGRERARPSGSNTPFAKPARCPRSRSTGSTTPATGRCACRPRGASSTRTATSGSR